MSKSSNNSTCKKEVQYSTFSKVIRFGSDLFSPVIPPPTTLGIVAKAVNPQDIILTRQNSFMSFPSTSREIEKTRDEFHQSLIPSKSQESEIPSGNAITIGPAGYIETVRSPYSNFSDIFFDVSYPFSVESSNNLDSINVDISGNNKNNSGLFKQNSKVLTTESLLEESHTTCILPPSSAILQSQLDNSSLDFFISNNSFLEEIKSSLSVEQQQYINSGMTNSTSSDQCTTVTPSITTRSDDMNTDLNSYDDIFETGASEDESDNCYSILVSPSSNYYSLDEDEEEDVATIKSVCSLDEVFRVDNPEIRLRALLTELRNFNKNKNLVTSGSLEDIKNKYISEINEAFIHNNTVATTKCKRSKTQKLHTAIIKSYKKANNKIDPPVLTDINHGNTSSTCSINQINEKQVSVSSIKKRKFSSENTDGCNDDKNHRKKLSKQNIKENKKNSPKKEHIQRNEEAKKSRKNYNSDIINTLMDWYLENDGKVPTNESKRLLCERTDKSNIQISTWFQNARRRYQKKLEKFNFLRSMHPDLVYNYQSYKKFTKANK